MHYKHFVIFVDEILKICMCKCIQHFYGYYITFIKTFLNDNLVILNFMKIEYRKI